LKEYIDKYIDQGFKIFPCNSDKSPCTPQGFKNAHNNKEILYKQFYKPDMLIGLPCGDGNGIVVVDIDTKDGRSVDELKEEIRQFGELPPTYEVETMNGGRHLYYKIDTTILSAHTHFFDKSLPVDLRGNGSYVITADYKKYFPLDVEDIDDIKQYMSDLPDWIENYKKKNEYTETPDGEFLPESEVRELRSALSYISSDDRETWVNVGMALKNTRSVQAKGIWTEWSMKSDKFDPVDSEKKWKTFKPSDITIATIFHIAKQNGWVTTYERPVFQIFESMPEIEIQNVFDELDRIKNFRVRTYSVGLVFLLLNRADIQITRDALIVSAGEKSSGKTSFVTHYVFEIMKHNPDFCCIFYSLDDPDIISSKRFISQGIGKNILDDTEFDTTDIDNILKRIIITESDPPSAEIIIDKKKISISEQLIEIAERVKKSTGTTRIIIIIDYLQYVKPSGDRTDLNEVVKQYKTAQKKLASNGGCIFFLLSQMNRDRDSENRFRESSEIENVADIILNIRPNFVETVNPQTGKKRYVIDKTNPQRFISIDKNKIKPGQQGEFHTCINSDFSFQPLIDPNETSKSLIQNQPSKKNQVRKNNKKSQPWEAKLI